MLTFAVVAGRHGDVLPPQARERLDVLARLDGTARQRSGLALRPDDVIHRWESDSASMSVVGFEPHAQPLGTGSRWHADSLGLTAFTGIPRRPGRNWDDGETWAEQLARRCRQDGHDWPRRLSGVHCTVSVDATGRGAVTTDPMGFSILYRASGAGYEVLSTRAALAAWLAAPEGSPSPRDVEHAGALAFCGFALDDRTGFRDVRCVPAGSWCRFDGNGPDLRTVTRSHWYEAEAMPLGERVEQVRNHIEDAIRFAVDLPTPTPVLELTGGMDSRLMVAVASDAGLAGELTYMSWGSADHPDVRIADAVLDELGLSRSGRYRPGFAPAGADGGSPEAATEPATPEQAFRRHILETSGCISSWHQRPAVGLISRRSALCGIETLRATRTRMSWLSTPAELEAYVFLGGLNTDPAGIMTRDARRHHQDQLLGSLHTDTITGDDPQDIFDLHDITVRLRRWFGTFDELDTRNRVYPLIGAELARHAFAIGPDLRRASVLHFDLMAHAAPDLARLPFAGGGWPSRLAELRDTRGLPMADPEPTDGLLRSAVRAVAGARRVGAPTAARRAGADAIRWIADRRAPKGSGAKSLVELAHESADEAQLAVLRERFDVGAGHPLADRIDLAAARAKVDRYAQITNMERRGLHDAATALAWVAGRQ